VVNAEPTRLIDADEASEIAWGESFEGYEFIAKQHISDHRWYTRQLIVFKHDGALLGFFYMDPKTEMQDGQDRFESDPVKAFAVEGREVTTTVYAVAS
jgi:hypothetical protein